MRPDLAALARTQSGLVLRHQAVLVGYTERELRSHLAVHGPWTVVRRGVYVATSQWDAGSDEDRWRLRDRAADLTTHVEHAMSHDSAARALGIPLLRPRRPLSHLVRPGVWGSRSEHGVKHHLSRTMPAVVLADGMRVTAPVRTALDLAREHGFQAGVAACDAVRRRGVRRDELEADLDLMTSWPHITRARAAVEHSDPGAENPGESLARLLVAELGLGTPTTQFPVRTHEGVKWCDLQLGCHVFEFDGRLKYRRPENGGVADRPAEDVVWAERQRERLICAEGLGMSRIVWDDLFGQRRSETLRRLSAEVELTRRRFGADLSARLRSAAAGLRDARRARIFRPADAA